jgi:predicted esterase
MFSMLTKTPEQHIFQAHLDCRYLLQIPENSGTKPLLVIALHGYSSNPEVMLRLTSGLVDDGHIIASIQAPNQHYVADGLPDAHSVAGYNWGIRPHWESSVRLHHEMLRQVLKSLRERFEVGQKRCLLVGFSQPVGLNYRFVGTYPHEVGGVIGICGGVPRDWQEEKYQAVRAALLHISRDEDPIYPVATAGTFAEKLKHRANDVEFHLIPGPHRFPSKAKSIVGPWLERVFGDVRR